MKKKAKILTTVASLCLAVALMAFGVYAMTQATMAVTAKVTFTVQDIFADITLDAYTVSADATPVETRVETQATRTTYSTVSGKLEAINAGNADTLTAWTPTTADLTSTVPTAKWVITIENKSTTNAIYVRVETGFTKTIAGTSSTAKYQVFTAGATDTPSGGTVKDITEYARTATAAQIKADLDAEGGPTTYTNMIVIPASTSTANSKVVLTFTRTITEFSKSITEANGVALGGSENNAIILDNVPNSVAAN